MKPATLCDGSCNPVQGNLQPYATEPATNPTYQDDAATKAKVSLASTKWRPAGAPAAPRYEWYAAAL